MLSVFVHRIRLLSRYTCVIVIVLFGVLCLLFGRFLAVQFASARIGSYSSAYANGNYHSAERYLQQARWLGDDRPFERAIVAYHLGRRREALQILQSLDSTDDRVNNAIGVILFQGNEYAEGMKYLVHAAKVAPDNPVYHHNLSVAFAKTGRTEMATEERSLANQLSKGQSGNWSELIVARKDVVVQRVE